MTRIARLPAAALLAVACLGSGTLSAAASTEFEPKLRALASGEIAAIVADPALIAAVQAQNAANAGLDEAAVIALDAKWRAEIGTASTPTITPVLANPVSDYLRRRRDAAGGLFTEIFVMDAVGLNVATSDVTSDMWQGDEAKWRETFGVGPGAVHVSDVELDESTQTYQAQVSVAITDPATGAVIGAATFGVNVELLP